MNEKEYWDIRGRSFPGYQPGNEFQARVLEIIKKHGVDFFGTHILDLGCGTGSYAIPFAKMAKLVTALDISTNMLERLKSTAQELGITNINYVECDWADYEVKEKFDIIFCCRSPAMKDSAALKKVCNSTTKWGITFQNVKSICNADTFTLGRPLLELFGISPPASKNDFVVQDCLKNEGIPFTVYPMKGERRSCYTLEELTKNACDIVESAGTKPDQKIILKYLEKFYDKETGKYLSINQYDMELVIWGSGLAGREPMSKTAIHGRKAPNRGF